MTRAAAAASVVVGLYGKLPARGDFVRRNLPRAFVAPWDAWLQAGMEAARAALGEAAWGQAWDAAPAWRFALPAGACGPRAAAGVLAPSEDAAGRRFPLTLAAVFPDGAPPRAPGAWCAALERAASAARADEADADALAAALPTPEGHAEAAGDDDLPGRPEQGWWTLGGGPVPAMVWALPALPDPADFALLLLGTAPAEAG